MLNTTHDVHIAQLVKPEVVNDVCRHKKVPFRQLFVDFVSRHVQSVQDPLFYEALVPGGLHWNQNGKIRDHELVPSNPR